MAGQRQKSWAELAEEDSWNSVISENTSEDSKIETNRSDDDKRAEDDLFDAACVPLEEEEEGTNKKQKTSEMRSGNIFDAIRANSGTNGTRSCNSSEISNAIHSYAEACSKSSDAMKTAIPVPANEDSLSLTGHLGVFNVTEKEEEEKEEVEELEVAVKEEKTDTPIILLANQAMTATLSKCRKLPQDEDAVMFSPPQDKGEGGGMETPKKEGRNVKRPFMFLDSPRTSSPDARKALKAGEGTDVHSKQERKRNTSETSSSGEKLPLETDVAILARRQKQIQYGKNTSGYEKYLAAVPKHKRKKEDPKTPPRTLKFSRRAWDGLIRNWRQRLHKWDDGGEKEDYNLDLSVDFDLDCGSEQSSTCGDGGGAASIAGDDSMTPSQKSMLQTTLPGDWIKSPPKRKPHFERGTEEVKGGSSGSEKGGIVICSEDDDEEDYCQPLPDFGESVPASCN